jgi:mevalonate kinase
MTSFEGRASGKVILFGEHAVVYGVAGIAAGIDRGAVASATTSPSSSPSSSPTGSRAPSRLVLGASEVEARPANSAVSTSFRARDDLTAAFDALCAVEPSVRLGLSVRASAELPPGGGLGCSAALGVAIARAVEAMLEAAACAATTHAAAAPGATPRDEGRVLERALAWERVFHGNPSGIDTAAAAMGCALRFVRGTPARPLSTARDVWLAVGFSGRGASTRAMVEHVGHIGATERARLDEFLAITAELTERAMRALASGDEVELGALFDRAQRSLSALDLSTPAIDTMIDLASRSGALGSKLTGSGGGGSVIALGGMAERETRNGLAEQRARAIAASWSERGYPAFATKIPGRDEPTT